MLLFFLFFFLYSSSHSQNTSTTSTTLAPTLNIITDEGTPDNCDVKSQKFMYTPCDEFGNRWKVQVPETSTCTIRNPVSPEKGVKCSFTCSPGEYLDIKTQQCLPCKGGTYSVGDGKRFTNWDKLPEEFETRGHASASSHGPHAKHCEQAVWKAKGDYLQSNGSFCRSILRMKVDVVKDGNITFVIKSDDESAFFHVWVEGSQTCSSNYDATLIDNNKNSEMYYTLTNTWSSHTLDLDKGYNTIYFVAAYFSNSVDDDDNDNDAESKQTYETTSERAVLIKEITVRGFPYSQTCEQCDAGTFSLDGASECTPCKENTFSKKGENSCKDCFQDQFAAPGSEKCTPRKTCTEQDYHETWDACINGGVTKRFDWNDPKTCKDDEVSLPSPRENLMCPSCNPGMFFNGSTCVYCGSSQKSENDVCVKCPPKTQSAPGLFYNIWTKFPTEPMHLFCLARPSTGCRSKKGWVLKDSYITSGFGHSDDAELIMYINVDEFTSRHSNFTMVFEITGCTQPDNCRLKIESIDDGSMFHVLKVFEGNTKRTKYLHKRHSSVSTKYRLVFEKLYDEDQQTFASQSARVNIYSIEVTNVAGGGAKECVSCETGVSGDCINCPAGQYIQGHECAKCPANTYLRDTEHNSGFMSCQPCPKGTVSSAGSSFCHSDCIMRFDDRTYNFTRLSGYHVVNTAKTFTSKGFQYWHGFNISFCGHPYIPSVCSDTVVKDNTKAIVGSICRSTFIPDGDKHVLAAQSMSVGEYLQSVTLLSDDKNDKKKDENTTAGSSQMNKKHSKNDQVSVTFFSPRRTVVCENGTTTTIHFVCDPTKDDESTHHTQLVLNVAFHRKMMLSKDVDAKVQGELSIGYGKCTGETCNGCEYLFTWRSRFACPTCTTNDYKNITTGCEKKGTSQDVNVKNQKSKKTLTYLWKDPHICIGGASKPDDVELQCTIFEKSILDLKVVIMAFLLGAVLLTAGVIFLCYRNRRLSYKYSRLIDSSQAKDGELPAAEMCVSDGEEEDEEVILSRGKGGKRILDRIKKIGKSKNKEDFSEFETINLDSMKNFTDEDDDDEL